MNSHVSSELQAKRIRYYFLDYPKDSVFKIFNKGVVRKTFIYARVSTAKQKPDLDNQISMLKQFCFSNDWCINNCFSDIASGISFEKRKEFFIQK